MLHSKRQPNFPQLYIKGFTLMEVIVVVAIVALTLQVVSAIAINIVRQQIAINALAETKRQGDLIFERIKSEVGKRAVETKANPSGLEIDCLTEPGSSMINQYFTDSSGTDFYFYQSSQSIYYVNGDEEAVSLADPKVSIADFSLVCFKPSEYSGKVITLDFDILSSVDMPYAQGKRVNLHYSTKIIVN
jgi:prepilin-type N-terminal cleavage/methylation domain-containing protein